MLHFYNNNRQKIIIQNRIFKAQLVKLHLKFKKYLNTYPNGGRKEDAALVVDIFIGLEEHLNSGLAAWRHQDGLFYGKNLEEQTTRRTEAQKIVG